LTNREVQTIIAAVQDETMTPKTTEDEVQNRLKNIKVADTRLMIPTRTIDTAEKRSRPSIIRKEDIEVEIVINYF